MQTKNVILKEKIIFIEINKLLLKKKKKLLIFYIC